MAEILYKGILNNSGKIIHNEAEAFVYALEKLVSNEQERKEFIEWFYSGNWVEVKDDE